MTYSNLVLGTSVIINDVENYKPGEYIVLPLDSAVPLKNPWDLPENYLADEAIKAQIGQSGSFNLSPFAMNWNQLSKCYSVFAICRKYSNTLQLSSCRVDAIARDPGLVELISYFGSTTIVCAVEGISERICNFLQKSLLPEELYVGVNNIIKQQFKSIKFYYILTGTETDEDIAEFEVFLAKLDELRRYHHKPDFVIRFSFSPLISTLQTPSQYQESKISSSIRFGSRTMYLIQNLCRRYGFIVRLSSGPSTSDFTQFCEMTDRRAGALFSYASINGIARWPNFSINAGSEGEKQAVLQFKKLYALVNETTLFPEWSGRRLSDSLIANDGKPFPEELLEKFTKDRGKATLLNADETPRILHAVPGDSIQHYYTTEFVDPNTGKPREYCHMAINLDVGPQVMDEVKTLLPLFTNGQTFEDVVCEKSALHIFPSTHIRTHENRSIGADFKAYSSAVIGLFDSYCHGEAVGKSLVGSTKVRVRIRKVREGEEPIKCLIYKDRT